MLNSSEISLEIFLLLPIEKRFSLENLKKIGRNFFFVFLLKVGQKICLEEIEICGFQSVKVGDFARVFWLCLIVCHFWIVRSTRPSNSGEFLEFLRFLIVFCYDFCSGTQYDWVFYGILVVGCDERIWMSWKVPEWSKFEEVFP